jgi:hypothetical protein
MSGFVTAAWEGLERHVLVVEVEPMLAAHQGQELQEVRGARRVLGARLESQRPRIIR